MEGERAGGGGVKVGTAGWRNENDFKIPPRFFAWEPTRYMTSANLEHNAGSAAFQIGLRRPNLPPGGETLGIGTCPRSRCPDKNLYAKTLSRGNSFDTEK